MENKFCPRMCIEPYAGEFGLCYEKSEANDYKACSCDFQNGDYHNCKLFKTWIAFIKASSEIEMY